MKVFVYGTLLKGEPNHGLLGDRKPVRARTTPVFRMHSLGGFPGVVRGGRQSIVGEVYDVDEKTLARLDRLEGHPRFYHRTPVRLETGEDVFTYLLPPDRVRHYPVVTTGDWRAWCRTFERVG